MSRIFITGGTGFLGNFLVKKLLKEENEIVCLIRKKEQVNRFPKAKNLSFVFGDITDMENLKGKIGRIDYVIHVGGVTHSENPEVFFKTNVLGTKNILNYFKKKRIKKFIYISSANVLNSFSDAYSKSKKQAEAEVQKTKISYIILRPSLIYGPGDSKNIGLLIKKIKKYHICIMIGNGKFLIQPVYINDVVSAVEAALVSKKNRKIYVLAGPPITYIDLLKVICKNFKVMCIKIKIPKFIAKTFVRLFNTFGVFSSLSQKIDNWFKQNLDENYNTKESEKDLKIKFIGFEDGIKQMIKQMSEK